MYNKYRFYLIHIDCSVTTVTFRCKRYAEKHCLARLTQKDGVVRTNGVLHCHPAETEEIKRLAVVSDCVKQVAEQRGRGPGLKLTFNSVRQR